ncbi:MAG: spore maturation protein A [Clostridia bacterium]|nr:spore maturation protein A [Clostridia bacterium]
MNYIWSGLLIISFVFAALGGNLQETLTAGLSGAASSIEVLLSFAGIMCFWSGILKIAHKSGAAQFCEKLLSPAVRRLFPRVKNRKSITMNIIANLLGMGNAATPAGVAAMCELDRENGQKPTPSHEMSRFAVLNTASLQLFPTTIIGILASCGSKDPFSIIPLIWISSAISLTAALLAEWLLWKRGDSK